MAHRIWKETKQEPGTARPGNMLGCCLVSFHFLWAILSTSTVLKRNSYFNVNKGLSSTRWTPLYFTSFHGSVQVAKFNCQSEEILPPLAFLLYPLLIPPLSITAIFSKQFDTGASLLSLAGLGHLTIRCLSIKRTVIAIQRCTN